MNNFLIRGITLAQGRIARYKDLARQYYYRVIFSLGVYACPACSGSPEMLEGGRCRCACGAVLDPTLAFQRSGCCDARLRRRRHHYACSACGTVVASQFLFDERIFNADYFREQMRQSRHRRQQRIEQLKQLLQNARSNPLTLTALPGAELLPGLEQELNSLLNAEALDGWRRYEADRFRLEDYRRHILESAKGCIVYFSAIRPLLVGNERLDRARRLLTLTIMWQEQEVMLTQRGNDIAVEAHETDQ